MATQTIQEVKTDDVFWFVGNRYTALSDAVKDENGWVNLVALKTWGGLTKFRLTEHDIVSIEN